MIKRLSLKRLSRHCRPPRRGFSLVETVVVVALTAILLGLVVTLLASLLGHQSATHQRAIQRSEINRLTDALRRDLRQAVAVPVIEELSLTIALPDDKTSHYSLDGDLCKRERDAFQIGPAAAWLIDDTEQSITVTIQRPPAAETNLPAIPIRIVAIQ